MTLRERLEQTVAENAERQAHPEPDDDPGDEVWMPLRASECRALLAAIEAAERLLADATEEESCWCLPDYPDGPGGICEACALRTALAGVGERT